MADRTVLAAALGDADSEVEGEADSLIDSLVDSEGELHVPSRDAPNVIQSTRVMVLPVVSLF